MRLTTRLVDMLWLTLISVALAFVIVLGLGLYLASAQEHVHPDETITDARVAQFYQSWNQPDERKVSCCDRRDCYIAEIRRRHGRWEYLHKWTGQWFPVPDRIIESNTKQPRESPDGQNHVCASPHDGNTVYCAVLSSGS